MSGRMLSFRLFHPGKTLIGKTQNQLWWGTASWTCTRDLSIVPWCQMLLSTQQSSWQALMVCGIFNGSIIESNITQSRAGMPGSHVFTPLSAQDETQRMWLSPRPANSHPSSASLDPCWCHLPLALGCCRQVGAESCVPGGQCKLSQNYCTGGFVTLFFDEKEDFVPF